MISDIFFKLKGPYILAVLATVLFLVGVYKTGYNSGKVDSQLSALEGTNKYLEGIVGKMDGADKSIKEMSDKFSDLKQELELKRGKSSEEVDAYAKSRVNSPVTNCPDPEWVRIYNNSLPR